MLISAKHLNFDSFKNTEFFISSYSASTARTVSWGLGNFEGRCGKWRIGHLSTREKSATQNSILSKKQEELNKRIAHLCC